MPDGYVSVGDAGATGKKVDTTELTRADGTIVERERVVIPDPVTIFAEALADILIELKMHSWILATSLNYVGDIDQLREDLRNDIINRST